MPRSTGGGSHHSGSRSSFSSSRSFSRSSTGGGSHSGGFRSSSGSRGFSSHSYSSSLSSSSYRSRPSSAGFFAGTRSGARYTRSAGRGGSKSGCGTLLIILLILGILAGFGSSSTGTTHTTSVPTVPAGQSWAIEDTLGVLGDTSSLASSMQTFQDRTGIVPVVVTLNNESWNNRYSNLSAAAYDLYGTLFQDESHWLLVYSQPSSPDPSFNEWYWEGVAGDNTEGVLTDSKCDTFGTRLQRYLSDTSVSTGDAFARSLSAITPAAASTSSGKKSGSNVFVIAIVCTAVFVIVLVRNTRRKNGEQQTAEETASAPEQEIPVSEPVQSSAGQNERACAYCGCVLPEGAVKCPGCGAARTKQS